MVTAIMVIMMAMSAIAYAATDGKIVDYVRVWINGESKELVDGDAIKSEDGKYTIQIKKVADDAKKEEAESEIYEDDAKEN